MIVIVDYGMGNLSSIQNMFKKIGVKALISSSPETIATATKIILPGVGAFDNAMENIQKLQLPEVLGQKALVEKVPVLGICLGMQLLLNSSEEGTLPGLGWIEGKVKRFSFSDEFAHLKVPHMGWNIVRSQGAAIFSGLQDARFYFVHSYFVDCKNDDEALARTTYGFEFTSAVRRENIFGTQFHPEKSHKFGMRMLKNFAEIC